MTNEELFQDLKQYIDGRFDQVEGRFEQIDSRIEKLDEKIDSKIDSLRVELIDGMNQQTETIIGHIDGLEHRHSARIDDHETRIAELESAR